VASPSRVEQFDLFDVETSTRAINSTYFSQSVLGVELLGPTSLLP